MREVDPYELADRGDVAVDVEELLIEVRLGGATEPCAHGVDEHHVSLVEPSCLIVDQLIWRRWQRAIIIELDALGSEGTEMKPHRSRTWSAIKAERQRPCASGVG